MQKFKNSIRRLFIVSCLFFSFVFLFSQSFKSLDLPVTVNNKQLKYPWIGGLNTPQIMNSDVFFAETKAGVTLFDRTGSVWLPFEVKDGKLIYRPSLKPYYPKVKDWVAMYDYNEDKTIDIFSYSTTPGVAGIDVYRQVVGTKSSLFEKITFPNDRNDILYYQSGNSRFNIYVSNIDYPGIADIDRDGDVDILSYDVGGSQVIWYKNQAVEKKLGKNALDFVIADACYGKIVEDGFSEKITLSLDRNKCASGLVPPLEVRHSGSTILTFDRDGDRDYDLMIGDISSSGLIYLRNGGDTLKAWMDQEEIKFPVNSKSVDIPYFVTPFIADVNGDGKQEFFAASNFNFGSDNYNCLWRYDQDQTTKANFNFISNSFIVDECIDFGENTYPALADVDADGLLDIVVGSGGYFDRTGIHDAGIFLFKNVGTEKNPAFKLVDSNWLNIKSFNSETNSFAPAFGDIDNDGDLDLMVGELLGRLFFAENMAGKNKPMTFNGIKTNYFNIDVGQYSTPQIFDLDKDGKQDLIIGERDGTLNFFKNKGSSSVPLFSSTPDLNYLGKIDTRVTGFATGNAAPYLFQGKNKTYLAVGTSGKDIILYQDPKASADSFSQIISGWGKIHEGDESHPALADIDGDGFLDILIGNQRGGLAWYSTDIESDIRVNVQDKNDPNMIVFPNPAGNSITIFNSKRLLRGDIRIYSLNGQLILKQKVTGNRYSLPTNTIDNGIYFIEISSTDGVYRQKLIIHR